MRLEIRGICTPDPEHTLDADFRTSVRTNAAGRYSYLLTAADAHKTNDACAAAVVYPIETRDSCIFRRDIRLHG